MSVSRVVHARVRGDIHLERVFGVLPDETRVYPGHGADTTLGREQPAIRTWRARGW
jgi:hypothetical protein